jgi:serine/threonine-protein kinase
MTSPKAPSGDTGPVAGGATAARLEPAERIRAGLSERGIDLGDEVGRGAMSVVYRATDRRHARPVAVKVLEPSSAFGGDPDLLLREIQLAAGLQHPHIMPVYESGAVDGAPFFVMPYVDGESLRHRLARGWLPVEEALRIATEVADALRYAHAHGVVHRDIKPENVLLEAGHAMLADFGVALAISVPDGELTERRVVVGTPAYMSPEQASGDIVLDGRSDLYALACMLYEMLAGEPPFRGPTPQATIARRFLGPPVPLRQRRPEVPDGVAAAVERALALDPADRFPSAADFLEALAAAERKSGVGEMYADRWGRRGVAVGAGALVLAAIAMLAMQAPNRRSARLDPRRVAVAALSNETGDSALAPLGRMVASWITDGLGGTAGIEVVTSAAVVPAQHDQHLAQSDVDDLARLHILAAETRAGTLVSGSYYRGSLGPVEFHVEITDANSGQLLRAIGPITSGTEPERTAATLGRAVAAAVDSLLLHPGTISGAAHRPAAASLSRPVGH